MDTKKIGNFIYELRQEKKMTQEDLATKLYIDRSLISRWERGKSVPSPEFLMKLSSTFHVSVSELLIGERETEENKASVNELPITILKSEKEKRKKMIFFSLLGIFMIMFLFFFYYFMMNYNSIKTYKIVGEGDNFYINNGILVSSREKVYLNIGGIKTIGLTQILSYELYYEKDGEEYQLASEKSFIPIMIVNHYDKDSLFPKEALQDIKNHLYLRVSEKNNGKYVKSVIKLDVKEDFTNDFLH